MPKELLKRNHFWQLPWHLAEELVLQAGVHQLCHCLNFAWLFVPNSDQSDNSHSPAIMSSFLEGDIKRLGRRANARQESVQSVLENRLTLERFTPTAMPILKQLLEIIVQLGVPQLTELAAIFLNHIHRDNLSFWAVARRTPACVHPALAQRWHSWHQQIGPPSAPKPRQVDLMEVQSQLPKTVAVAKALPGHISSTSLASISVHVNHVFTCKESLSTCQRRVPVKNYTVCIVSGHICRSPNPGVYVKYTMHNYVVHVTTSCVQILYYIYVFP